MRWWWRRGALLAMSIRRRALLRAKMTSAVRRPRMPAPESAGIRASQRRALATRHAFHIVRDADTVSRAPVR